MGTHTLPEGFSDFDMFTFGSALLVGGLLGFFLNSISILAFLRVKEMRSPSSFLVFNLALADLSLNLNGLTAAYASYLRYWPFGQEGCDYHGFQGMVSVLASISFMAAIAWDRYHQYCTRQKLFWSTTITICSIIWILSILWSAFPLMGWGVYDFEPMRVGCTLDYTKGDRDYITYMLSLVFFYLMFPSFIMLSCYDAIYKHFKKIHHYRFNTSLPLRVMLMCWGPYVLMCIYACFDNVKLVSPKLRMLLPVIAKTNPFFNALLYSFGNEFYRGGVWNFLTGQKIVEPDVKKSKQK
ncbi:RPE-retinal G protein-coupled receptor [Oryzias melastigma]|uniref:RPE-retinal G protein-coupled receptor n=2 Tax=Oryzias melastigma TaxID=30732 RepID=A0A3B3BXZ3_ORYME|nr:retinal G protein coupled receptor b [Oryzias melastigma]KAF6719341.1 RPE-retinal G protein-coupled receptor [Oryzias melastigma]